MEFKIINPTDDGGFLQAIEFNFDELKTELTQRLEKYQNLTYTEETLKEAKNDKAGLNKFKDAIETRRKDVKKLCLKPYEEFEKKVKELVALIDEPINAIDTQLKDFEDKRISAKLCDIADLYNAIFNGWTDVIRLEKIFNEKWKNATYKMATIQTELQGIKDKFDSDLKVIADMKLPTEIELQVKDKYIETLEFSKAIAEKTRLEELAKKLEAKRDEDIKKIHEAVDSIEVKPTEPIEEKSENPIFRRKFWVEGTKEQLIELGKYLKNNNLKYGGIE